MSAARRRVLPVLAGAASLATIATIAILAGAPASGPKPQRVFDPAAHASERRAAETRARFDQAVVMLHARKYDHAATALHRVLELSPAMPEAHVNMGYALLGLGRHGAARGFFTSAIDLRPGQANAYYGLAMAAEGEGDLESALGAMRSYLHLSRDGDKHRARARSALWEWEAALGRHRLPTLASLGLADLEGAPVVPDRYRGKVVVLNLWATWCGPCRKELPSLERLQRRLDPARFAVMGIALQDDAAAAREFVLQRAPGLPTLVPRDRAKVSAALAVGALPTTLLVGPEGDVLERVTGAREWDAPELVARIEAMAAPRPAKEALHARR